MPCPNRVSIPGCFNAYNVSYANGFVAGMTQYVSGVHALSPKSSMRVSNCVKCGLCEEKCPQRIKIMSELGRVKKRMEPFWVNVILKIFSKAIGHGRKT
jgi:predicted aldo/keto reductase-like oxidoreductase